MKLNFILIVISMFSLSQLVVTQKDFCQSYADNDFNIDYGYPSELEMFRHEVFLFIGHDYWLIDADTAQITYFIKGKSKTINNWFGSQYRAAIVAKMCCIKFKDNTEYPKPLTGLLFKRNNTIDWARIISTSVSFLPDDLQTLPPKTLVRYDKYAHFFVNRTQIDFEPGFNPSIGFNYNTFIEETPYCFLQQNKLKENLFERTYRCYDIDKTTGKATNATDKVIAWLREESGQNGSDYSLVNKVRDNREVIAIFDKKRTLFMILEKEGKAITICGTMNKALNEGCFENGRLGRTLLINCSDYKKSTPTTTKATIITSKLSSPQIKTTSKLPIMASTRHASHSTLRSSTQTTKPLQTFVSTERLMPSITSKTKSVIILSPKTSQPTNTQNISMDSLSANENQKDMSLQTKARSLTSVLVLIIFLFLY